MSEERINELENRLEMAEFKLQLLYDNTDTDRLLFDYDISRNQYVKLMDLMNKFRNKLENGEEVSHASFESNVYTITGREGDYHFCEYLARSFMEEGRWEEVFPALYGNMAKYKHYMKRRINGED